jgi:alkaline phosphatase D
MLGKSLGAAGFLGVLAACGPAPVAMQSHQATGVKVGDVTSTSAIIWTRLTEDDERNWDGIERRGRPNRDGPPEEIEPRELEGSTPGAPGHVRVRYGTSADLAGADETKWKTVRAEDDFTHQFKLQGLQPNSKYYFEVETSDTTGEVRHLPLSGTFRTAPPPDQHADVTFTVITGQAYRDADDPEGFKIYRAMAKLEPHFIVPTGDTVYYDSDDPLVTNIDLARYHWRRMYSYPTLVEFHRHVPGYWEKDDHDSYANDNWPGLVRPYMGSFTFEQGQQVFGEQVPIGDTPYRTFRWGAGLQVWIVEGRDFRSPNTMPDGPEKSIWGAEQREWLTRTLLESDADWKILVSPTPIVGPDRENKADNHANEAFSYEGAWFRKWATEKLGDNFFVANGDRHWQYHSVDPETGLQEFSCGPASDQHASGSPGLEPEYHKYHNQRGGFLSVGATVEGEESVIAFRFHDIDGKVDHEWSARRPKHNP